MKQKHRKKTCTYISEGVIKFSILGVVRQSAPGKRGDLPFSFWEDACGTWMSWIYNIFYEIPQTFA